MKNLTANKIHKLCDCNIPFAQWLEKEKLIYKSKINDGIIQGKISFINWLNRKWQPKLKLNADGTILGNIGRKVSEGLKESVKTEYMPENEENIKKTILGLRPMIFYTVTGVGLFAIGFVIYKVIKKIKK